MSQIEIEISTGKIREIQKRVDDNSELIERIVDQLVKHYCGTLDDYMDKIKRIISDEDNPPTDMELDEFALNLPVLSYFTGGAQESLGIKADIAKSIVQEIYNKTYEESTGTVAARNAKAELMSQNEAITNIAYQRAYKKIKLRMDAAGEMLQSVKKVITRRGQEYELSGMDAARIGRR